MKLAIRTLAALVCLTACSSGAKSVTLDLPVSSAPSGSAAPAASPSRVVVQKAKVGNVYGQKADAVVRALGCTGSTPASGSSNVGPKPTDDVYCTFAGAKVEIETWSNPNNITALVALASGFMTTGQKAYYASGDGWTVGRDRDGSAFTPSNQAASKQLAESVVAVIGGNVQTVSGG